MLPCHAPLGDPACLKKKISDHKLLIDAKGILKKYETLIALFILSKVSIFAKKWVWPFHAPQGRVTQHGNMPEKILKIFINH